jgi:DNA repair protein SbcD/Mre11
MRFLHLADVHLDTAFSGRTPEVALTLQRASRTAFGRAVDAAIREEVDAVLIAGDLFDGDRLSIRTERYLHEVLARLGEASIPVVYVTGNHDPGGGAGPASRVQWPGHVRLIDHADPVTVEIRREGELRGMVTGAGHPSSRTTEDLSRRFPRPDPSHLHIALLHTQVTGSRGSESHDPYAPSELGFLESSGHDYWALGHVHARQCLSSHPPIHYPGNLQGRHPGETGAKGGLLVDLARRGAPTVDFLEFAPVRWETLRIVDPPETHLPALARKIESKWREQRSLAGGTGGTEWILRLDVTGRSPLHRELAREETRDELRDVLGDALGLLDVQVRVTGIHSPRDPEDYLGRDDVLGEALRLARSLARPDGPSPTEVLGLAEERLAGSGETSAEALDTYLRELLDGADTAILDAMLREDGR